MVNKNHRKSAKLPWHHNIKLFLVVFFFIINKYNNVVLHPTLICQAPRGEIEIYLIWKPPTVELCSTSEFEFWFRASKYLKPSDQQNSLNSCFPAWVKEGGDSGNNDNDLQFMKYPVVVLKPRETPCIPAYCIITVPYSPFFILYWRFSLSQLNRHTKSKVWIKGMTWKFS